MRILEKEKLMKGITWCIVIGLILAIIPLIALAPFAHSCADDYSYGYALHNLLVESNPSVLEMLNTVIKNTYEYYITWQETYSSIFLMSIQPAVYSEKLYIIVPFIMIGSMIASIFIFMKVLLTTLLKAKWYHIVSLSAVVSCLTLEYVSSPVESFFWFNSGVHYTIMFSCMLLLISCIIKLYSAEKIKAKYIFLAIILEIMVGEGNYITLLVTFILLSLFIGREIYVEWIKKKNFRAGRMYVYCVLYLIYVLAAVVNMIAPGNQKRKSLFAGLSISESIITSMKAGILAIDFCTTIIIILSLVVLIPIIWDMLEGSKYQFRYPALVVLISFGIFSSMYAPLYYSFGLLAAPRRAVNIIIEAYYILIVVNLIYILGWLKKNVIQVKEKIELNKLVYYGFSAVVILLGTMALGNKEQLNSYVGFQTLISGEGQTYHQEVMERIEVLNNPDISEVELKPFTCKPKLLFMSDITEDITDYKNQACALYYGKEAVKLEEE